MLDCPLCCLKQVLKCKTGNFYLSFLFNIEMEWLLVLYFEAVAPELENNMKKKKKKSWNYRFNQYTF